MRYPTRSTRTQTRTMNMLATLPPNLQRIIASIHANTYHRHTPFAAQLRTLKNYVERLISRNGNLHYHLGLFLTSIPVASYKLPLPGKGWRRCKKPPPCLTKVVWPYGIRLSFYPLGNAVRISYPIRRATPQSLDAIPYIQFNETTFSYHPITRRWAVSTDTHSAEFNGLHRIARKTFMES
jgi:hypothetical protein